MLVSLKSGESTVKNKISILSAAIAVLSLGQHPAQASLIGMPLNLKIVLEARDAQVPVCQAYTDDVFAGPVLIRGC
jgi:hypothetical protein